MKNSVWHNSVPSTSAAPATDWNREKKQNKLTDERKGMYTCLDASVSILSVF